MSRRPTVRPVPFAAGGDEAMERRFPRRLLLGSGAAAAALAAVEAVRPTPAAAAPGTTAWALGGNTAVSTDATNFLGTKNAAPLVFKTGKSDNSGVPFERMRILTSGRVGIGTTAPAARLDVRATEATGIRGVTTDGSGLGAGVRGEASAGGYGVRGVTSGGAGVRGDALAEGGTGVLGLGGYSGVEGQGDLVGGDFTASSTDATATGVTGTGVTGIQGTGSDRGVYGTTSDATGGRGVWGHSGQYALYGTGASTAGVRADSTYVGVWGQGATYGAYAVATAGTGLNYGLFATSASTGGYALYAQGDARVTGTLIKAAGSFRIDHPLHPDTRWLSHSFVESPDMMNVYNGNVVLGKDGTAVVELPDYFEALNRDFRYQLTCIGGAALVYVAREIEDRRFTIAGGHQGLTVSWQVTGVRHDDYAKAHPIVVDAPKTGDEKGTRQFVPAGSAATRFDAAPAVRR